MSDFCMPEYKIAVEQLQPGVFIRLERRNWFNHPFLFNSFMIKDESQIRLLVQLGIREVVCVPERSERLPHPPGEQAEPAKVPAKQAEVDPELERLMRVKQERADRLRKKRESIARCEERYRESALAVEEFKRGVLATDEDVVRSALEFVMALSGRFLDDPESTLHLMNVLGCEEQIYSHELNVTILAMLLGRDVGLDKQQMIILGMAALLHDVGKERLDRKLLKKRGQLTKSEVQLLQKHVELGHEMLSKLASMPLRSLEAVRQHHEWMDGSGYPRGIKDEALITEARVLGITNLYDNLCNHPDPEKSLTPYLALSYMFTQRRPQLDNVLLSQFIRCMGIYPPGTVVQLTNGFIGMVMSVNPENQLCPNIVVYDPDVPRREALIVDLSEECDIKVEKSIRLAHLPEDITEYLSPRTRITYYVD
ncbi:MAG: HD-GYP domain-containing protein [Desulfovibrionaceae bacterium]